MIRSGALAVATAALAIACSGAEMDGAASTDPLGESQPDVAGSTNVSPASSSSAAPRNDVGIAAQIQAAGDAASELNLTDCASNLSDEQVNAAALLAFDLDQSMHELVACGGMTVSIAGALVTGLVPLVFQGEAATPNGFRYQGNGVHHTDGGVGGSVGMDVVFYEQRGGEFVLVQDDLFSPDSYLKGVELRMDGDPEVDLDANDPFQTKVEGDAWLEIYYESVGPWVELLGLGAEPRNPLRVKSLAEIRPDFSNLYVESRVAVSDQIAGSRIDYEVQTGKVSVLDVYNSQAFTYDVVRLAGANVELGQQLSLSEWGVAFVGGNHLDGAIRFTVEGRDLSYVGLLHYEQSAYAEVSLSCR